MRTVPPSGPTNANVMVVGEAPGVDEETEGAPFVGASGRELTRLLSEAGINRSDCFITNVARQRPPYNDIERWTSPNKKSPEPGWTQLRGWWVAPQVAEGYKLLQEEITRVKPKLIIALGGTALWALSGRNGIAKWRGSLLYEDCTVLRAKLIPTIHPAAVLREWSLRAATVADLRRAARYQSGSEYPDPGWRFIVRPGFDQCIATLQALHRRLGSGERLTLCLDLETRLGHISCIGIAWNLQDALCIPLMVSGRASGYWGEEEEKAILCLLHSILTHPLVEVVGQNLLYDCQYFHRHLGYVPRVTFDTMIGQHALFSSLPKSLGFMASLYCNYYVYWKDEGKDWRDMGSEDLLWAYNCRDCVYTLEVYNVLCSITERMHRWPVQTAQQLLFWPALAAMNQGMLVDQERRKELRTEVLEEIGRRKEFLKDLLGFDLNSNSPKQMMAFFYDDLRLPEQRTRAHKGIPGKRTLNDEALQRLAVLEPVVKPIVHAIADIRTLRIFQSTFIEAPLDRDGRMRSAINIGGSTSGKSAPVTFRVSSGENAFGGGANMQTVPSDKSKSVGKAKARGMSLPNLRDMFVCDPDHIEFEGDLERADLQVVAWESDDELTKAALRMGADTHLMNVYTLDGQDPPPLEELIERHKRDDTCTCRGRCYWEHRDPRKHKRERAKVFCHGTNYVGSARTMAAHIGWTVHETEKAQARWFGARPGIKRWHIRVEQQIKRHRFVENKFGYRWHIFDRLDTLLPEAVAWIPQSTVSNYINFIWADWYFNLRSRGVEVQLQVHDALIGQIRKDRKEELIAEMTKRARIVIPYEDPLVIPLSLKFSEKSWGDCE